ncbi:MAG: hypothetical protein ABJO09_06960, partial [Hyphomicrobiales bacterium]
MSQCSRQIWKSIKIEADVGADAANGNIVCIVADHFGEEVWAKMVCFDIFAFCFIVDLFPSELECCTCFTVSVLLDVSVRV